LILLDLGLSKSKASSKIGGSAKTNANLLKEKLKISHAPITQGNRPAGVRPHKKQTQRMS
jgi:hypothetical protein